MSEENKECLLCLKDENACECSPSMQWLRDNVVENLVTKENKDALETKE